MAKKKTEAVNETLVNVDKVLASIERSLNKEGKVSVRLDKADSLDVDQWLSTGSKILDYAISNRREGGIPVGKIAEISGFKGSGKSLIAYHIATSTHKLGGVVFYFDTERALNRDFVVRQGVDPKRFQYITPRTVEEGFEFLEKIIENTRTPEYDKKKFPVTVIWDSIAATKCQAEVAQSYDANERVGVKAKALSHGIRKLTDTLGYENITLLFTNHLMDNIGVRFGDKYKTPGGHAIDFYSSVLIRLEKVGGQVKDPKSKDTIGEGVKASVVKTRFGPNYRKAYFNNMYDFGPDDEGSWYTFLHEDVGEIKKSAGWSTIVLSGEDHKFQHSKWKQKLKEPEFRVGVLDLLEKYLVKEYRTSDDVVEVALDSITEEVKT